MNAYRTIRQGDILLVPASAPDGYETRKPGRCVVGYGEATGHHHVLENVQWVVAPGTTDDDLRRFAMGQKQTMPVFIVATEETSLTHPEHDALTIAPGVWRVIRQAQHVPGELPQAVYD